MSGHWACPTSLHSATTVSASNPPPPQAALLGVGQGGGASLYKDHGMGARARVDRGGGGTIWSVPPEAAVLVQELSESRGGRPTGPSVLNEPYGFRGPKAILNRASALVSACPQYANRHPRTLSNTTEPRPLYLVCVVVPLDELRSGREDFGQHRLRNQSPWTLL